MDKDTDYLKMFDRELKVPETKYMSYGQSKRIFSELHKVIDSSDVICTVLDARDPINTRCTYVEKFVKKNAPHKHVVLVLNKCDLIPTWATVFVLFNLGCMGQTFIKGIPYISISCKHPKSFRKNSILQFAETSNKNLAKVSLKNSIETKRILVLDL
jgi:nuclear GTP-binding protein